MVTDQINSMDFSLYEHTCIPGNLNKTNIFIIRKFIRMWDSKEQLLKTPLYRRKQVHSVTYLMALKKLVQSRAKPFTQI